MDLEDGRIPLVKEYRLTDHARFQMERRGVEGSDVARVLSAPEQAEVVRPGRVVYQSRFERGKAGRVYLLRVVVDVEREPAEVVTAYWTSQVEKYWRDEG